TGTVKGDDDGRTKHGLYRASARREHGVAHFQLKDPSDHLVAEGSGRSRMSHDGDFTKNTTVATPTAAPKAPPSHVGSSCWIRATASSRHVRRSVRKFQRLRTISSSPPDSDTKRPFVVWPELSRTIKCSPDVKSCCSALNELAGGTSKGSSALATDETASTNT